MLVQTDQAPAVVDPAALTPLCDEAELTELIDELVTEETPRLSAVVQEHGERGPDGRAGRDDPEASPVTRRGTTKVVTDAPHGTLAGYRTWGCRCMWCESAERAATPIVTRPAARLRGDPLSNQPSDQ